MDSSTRKRSPISPEYPIAPERNESGELAHAGAGQGFRLVAITLKPIPILGKARGLKVTATKYGAHCFAELRFYPAREGITERPQESGLERSLLLLLREETLNRRLVLPA